MAQLKEIRDQGAGNMTPGEEPSGCLKLSSPKPTGPCLLPKLVQKSLTNAW